MTDRTDNILHISKSPTLHEATLVLAFNGWMDGGGVTWKTKTNIETESRIVRQTDDRLVVSYRHRTPAAYHSQSHS